MSSIHFKFRSGSEYEPLFFDGHCISLKELRESIIEKKKMGKSTEFKLEVTDSTTEREYTNENEMIPKNTSLIVRRVPLYYDKSQEVSIKEAEARRAEDIAKLANVAGTVASETVKLEAIKIQSNIVNEESESAILSSNAQKIPICYLCKQNGHIYKNCPIMAKYVSKGKEPVHMFLKNQLGIPMEAPTKPTQKVVVTDTPPDHLVCSICKKLMNNAVLIPCCGASFCDQCIQDYLIDNSFSCANCGKKAKPDDLISNVSLRKSVIEFENSRVRTITTETHEIKPSVIPDTQSTTPSIPSLNKSHPLTTINPISNVTNSFASNALQKMALASSSLLIKSMIPKINMPPKFPLNLNKDLKMLKVAAPFLTTQYAKSVINGERVLTKDEFSSLKTTLKLECKNLERNKRRSKERTKRSYRDSPEQKRKSSVSKSRSRRRSRDSRKDADIRRESRRDRKTTPPMSSSRTSPSRRPRIRSRSGEPRRVR